MRTRGAEVSYQGQGIFIDSLDVTANAAYTQATTVSDPQNPTAEGKQFYRVPRWRANVVGTWHSSESTSFTVAGRYSGRQYNTLTTAISIPTPSVASANFSLSTPASTGR